MYRTHNTSASTDLPEFAQNLAEADMAGGKAELCCLFQLNELVRFDKVVLPSRKMWMRM